MTRITITLTNWEKFNPRKDYKKPTWFAVSNDIIDHPDFAAFTAADFHVLLYIFCTVSKRNNPTADLVFAHAKKHGIPENTLRGTVEKLESLKILTVIRTESVQNRPESDGICTLQRNRETEKQTSVRHSEVGFGPIELAEAWNSRMQRMKSLSGKPIPLVDLARFKSTQPRWKSAVARLSEEPKPEVWVDAIDRIARSEFCRGKGARGDWVANFEFLVRPDVLTKVLEGEYGCRPAQAIPIQPPPPVSGTSGAFLFETEASGTSSVASKETIDLLKNFGKRVGV